MYLYASEHAWMDYHLNEEKKNKELASAEAKKEAESNETGTTKAE